MIMRTNGTTNPDFRNKEIADAIKLKEEHLVKDTLILQKVNNAHREAFRTRFPGQIEHCMRLTAERLQGLLTKKSPDMTDTSTWSGSAAEIHDLAHGLYYLSIMNQHYPMEQE
jgi:hypothetical protein